MIDSAGTEQDIIDTVRVGITAHNAFSGGPDELAALLLSCAGPYRSHPLTPDVVRRIGWSLTGRAHPDFRAKLSLAVRRLAAGLDDAAVSFVDELRLWATRPGRHAGIGVTHIPTDRVVAQYDHTDATLAVNSELTSAGSQFPPQAITDAVDLLTAYLEDLRQAETPETPAAREQT